MIPQLIVDIDTADAVPGALAEYDEFIHFTANRMARKHSALNEDLVQEASIKLWQLDPTRFDGDDRWYVEQELTRHMAREAQREMRARGSGKRVWVKGL